MPCMPLSIYHMVMQANICISLTRTASLCKSYNGPNERGRYGARHRHRFSSHRRRCDHLGKAACTCNTAASSWLTHLFTSTELEMAFARQQPAEFLAGRLAVKHAARKAVGPLINGEFDLRWVETLEPRPAPPMSMSRYPLCARPLMSPR